MRETCARVLAAALMTGAIATAVGLPAAFESTHEGGRGLTAPPSSLQRTVRVPATIARERPARAERLVAAQPIHKSATDRAIVRQFENRPTAKPQPPAHPAPTPSAPQPETRELTSTTPAAAAQPTPPSTPAPNDDGKGKKGKGHGKAKGKANEHAPEASEVAPSSDETAAPQPAGGEAEDHGHGQANGHDKEKGHGQDKQD